MELNSVIFPFWLNRTVMEVTRKGMKESDKECATSWSGWSFIW